jgi:hypothetical protein
MQLFDETESLLGSVAGYLVDGWKRGDTLVVVTRPARWALVAAELQASGCPVSDSLEKGRLVALDAATTLATFMINGDPHPAKFRASAGDLIARLAGEAGTNLTIYGDMVDILASQGNFTAAERLEELWNDLATRHSFRLMCGYSSAHFGDEQTTAHLHRICGAHGASGARTTDLLATWLLAHRRSRYHIAQQ